MRAIRWRKSGCREEDERARAHESARLLHALSRCTVHEHADIRRSDEAARTLHYFDVVKPTSRLSKRRTLVKAERNLRKKRTVFNRNGRVFREVASRFRAIPNREMNKKVHTKFCEKSLYNCERSLLSMQ